MRFIIRCGCGARVYSWRELLSHMKYSPNKLNGLRLLLFSSFRIIFDGPKSNLYKKVSEKHG